MRIGHQHAYIYIILYSLNNMQCKRVTHGTETLSRVIHRGCHILMVTPAATRINLRFTCWNSDLLPVGKTAYSKEELMYHTPCVADLGREGNQQKQLLVTVKSFIP